MTVKRWSKPILLVAGLLAASSPAIAAPANDDFASAVEIASLPFEHVGDTTGATTEPGEPAPSCAPSGSTVWFRVAASESPNRLEVKTFGSKFDTVLAVFEGTSLGSLDEVACNDDSTDLGSQQSRVGFAAVSGKTYYLQVGGYEGAAGPLKLAVAQGLNDDFDEAIDIDTLPASHAIGTSAATREAGEPSVCAPIDKTVWYRLTLAAPASVVIDTFGSDFDTVLAVYTGTSMSNLEPIACNDESDISSQSLVSFMADAGVVYHVQAGGYFGSHGALVVNMASAGGGGGGEAPANDNFADATTVTPGFFEDHILTTGATDEPGEPVPSCAPGANSVWYRLEVSQDSVVTLDTVGSDYDTVLAVYTGDSLESLQAVEPLGCVDDVVIGTETSSALPLRAQAGVTYHIQITGYFGDTGGLAFYVTPIV